MGNSGNSPFKNDDEVGVEAGANVDNRARQGTVDCELDARLQSSEAKMTKGSINGGTLKELAKSISRRGSGFKRTSRGSETTGNDVTEDVTGSDAELAQLCWYWDGKEEAAKGPVTFDKLQYLHYREIIADSTYVSVPHLEGWTKYDFVMQKKAYEEAENLQNEEAFDMQAHLMLTEESPWSSFPSCPLKHLARHKAVAWEMYDPEEGAVVKRGRIGCRNGYTGSSDW